MAEDQFWQPQCPRRIGDRPFTYCYPDLQTSRDFCLDLSYSSHRLPSARTAPGIFTPKIFAKHLNCYHFRMAVQEAVRFSRRRQPNINFVVFFSLLARLQLHSQEKPRSAAIRVPVLASKPLG